MKFDVGLYWDALTSTQFLHGAFLTITLALASQVAATAIGFVLALMRTSKPWPVRAVSAVYVWIWRAIPTLLWLLLIWNALPQLIPALTEEWFTPFLAGFIGLSLAEAAIQPCVATIGFLMSIPSGNMWLSSARVFNSPSSSS